jgi:ABC-type phosphate transport system substrate-binding protein
VRAALRAHRRLPALLLFLGLLPARTSADVVAIVAPNSAILTLSKSQVADLFLGKARRFPDGSVALPVDQADGRSVRDEFYAKVADRSPAQIRAYWSKIIFTGRGQPPVTVPNSADMKKRIAQNPYAIGYIEANLVDASVRVVF